MVSEYISTTSECVDNSIPKRAYRSHPCMAPGLDVCVDSLAKLNACIVAQAFTRSQKGREPRHVKHCASYGAQTILHALVQLQEPPSQGLWGAVGGSRALFCTDWQQAVDIIKARSPVVFGCI